MHTLVRDRGTQTADFVFYADRLLRLVHQCSGVSRVCGNLHLFHVV